MCYSQVFLTPSDVKLVNKAFTERNIYRDRANELLGQLDSCKQEFHSLEQRLMIERKKADEKFKTMEGIMERDSTQIELYGKMTNRQNNENKLLKGGLLATIAFIIIKSIK